MTERLYYTDAYTTAFDATVLACHPGEHEGKAVSVLELDRTFFYPTSGGQPYDTGVLAGRPVLDVRLVDGCIYHVLDVALDDQPPVGEQVHGEIDWARRFDHMQQHTGQHLISQTFYRELGLETISVHFGAEDSTLDLDTEQIDDVQLDAVETVVNDLLYQNRPIKAYFVSEQELSQVPLRRAPKVSGQIRIVEIDGYDYSACGGTHVRTTAEIGLIKFLRQERSRGQARITFRCGKRALADYRHKHQLLTAAAAHFSTDIAQVPDLVARALEQNKTLQRQVEEQTAQLLGYEAGDLIAQAEVVGDFRVVARWFDERTPDQIRTLAGALQSYDHVIALVGGESNGKATVIFARAEGVPLHAGNLLRDALSEFGGGGGGRPDFAQGGGIDPARGPELLAFALEQARSEIVT